MCDVDDDWLSLQEAAERCGVAYRTLRAMVLRGELPAEPGKEWRLAADGPGYFLWTPPGTN
jgi:excisionase family DNA binding protein